MAVDDARIRVLIADDEFWVRQSIAGLIDWAKHGYELLPPAVDGEDAWAKIRQFQPDICLLDINMPFLSGTELTRRVRAEMPQTEVLILSGYSDFEHVREALTGGALDYLLKPADRDRLLISLRAAADSMLGRRREHREMDALRRRSALASSMLRDRELSDMLSDARACKGEQRAWMLSYDLRFSFYHLARLRIAGLRPDAGKSLAIKERLAEAIGAREMLAFHEDGRQDSFLAIVELSMPALRERLAALMSELSRRYRLPVSVLVSARKSSFRQLGAAAEELRQLRLNMRYARANALLCFDEAADRPSKNRVSPEQRRALEHAVKTRDRLAFRQLCREGIGLSGILSGDWRLVELLHALNTIRFTLSGGVESQGALDGLMELMLVAADRLDGAQVLSILDEMLDEAFPEPTQRAASEDMRRIARQAAEYIDAHFVDELSLSMLAKRFAVDDAHLSRTFKQIVGENLTLYIARRRIEAARQLIASRDGSLGEVASLVGYDDYAYFNRVFRKITGVSPSAYKEGTAQ